MEAGEATKGGSTSADEETDCWPSLDSLALMRKATTPTIISFVDMKDWCRVVYEGVLLKNNTQKFWVEKNLHKNCFLVLPKACDIAGDDDESCWSWITKEQICFGSIVDIPVPKLEKESFVFIQGRFKTKALSPNTTYEVAFVVQLISEKFSAQLELVLPDGTKQTREENLDRELCYEWINLRAGEFMMGPKTVGTIIFALQSRRVDPKRTGLIFGGVRIHPKD